MQANTNEMDRANHTDETKWLLPAYVADKPHQPKYSQVSKKETVGRWWRRSVLGIRSAQ